MNLEIVKTDKNNLFLIDRDLPGNQNLVHIRLHESLMIEGGIGKPVMRHLKKSLLVIKSSLELVQSMMIYPGVDRESPEKVFKRTEAAYAPIVDDKDDYDYGDDDDDDDDEEYGAGLHGTSGCPRLGE